MKAPTIRFSCVLILVSLAGYLPATRGEIRNAASTAPAKTRPGPNRCANSTPQVQRYQIDPHQSTISLLARAGVGYTLERDIRFGQFQGTLQSDGRETIAGDSIAVTIAMNSATLDDRMDTFVMKRQVLKPRRFPTCTLRSIRLEPVEEANTYRIDAELNLVGVTREESFAAIIEFQGDQIRCRSKEFQIKKTDYKMRPLALTLHEDIEIRFDIVFTRIPMAG
jgi:polyisoprenoid-binding protein YceI